MDQSPRDPSVTIGFEKLVEQEPWLTAVKKTVGYVRFTTRDGRDNLGSAILVGRDGKLLLCKHEVKGPNFEITFVTNPEG